MSRRGTRSGRAGGRLGDFLLEECVDGTPPCEVWRARHELSGQLAAVRFVSERGVVAVIRTALSENTTVRHPLIVEPLAADPDADRPWIACRWVEGESLRAAIRRGPLRVDVVLAVYGDLLAALEEAHRRGAIHGAVRPENILVDREGRAHLSALGLGKPADEEYAEPGRPAENGTGGDLYAVSVTLFEMLTGALPVGAESPSDLRPGLDPRVDDLFLRGHARAERRYSTARQALDDLDGVLASREKGTRSCPGCGTREEAPGHYCVRCGTKLRADLDRCSCGFLPERGDRFCIRCGEEFDVGRLV